MTTENKNAPLIAGWAIAAAAGAVAAGVAWVVVGLGLNQSVFVAALIFLIVGIILGLPGRVQQAAPDPVATHDWQPDTALSQVPAPAPVKPVASAAPGSLASFEAPRRPEALGGPRGGVADDLQLIEGIGPKLEELCHSLGFYHFDQIANWTAAEIDWVDSNLTGFKGRVTRDKWVAQAKLILSEGREEFLRRAKTNDY
jgi:NADH-quinone oxidoreductase subunit E